MRNFLGVILVSWMICNTSAFAELQTQKQQCANISKMAEMSMALRQYEAPISVPLKTSQQFADDGTTIGIETTALMDSVIMDAYSQDLEYSERMKQVSINEFATKYYLKCMWETD